MGERRRLDPVKTREAIFSAAIALFAEKGYEGASIADVAKVAGVQKSLVQYHFGSKFGLWSATMGDRAQPMMAMLERAAAGEVAPRDLVAARFEMLRRNPEMARIMTWISLQSFPLPRPLEERREKIRSVAVGKDGVRLELLLGFCALDGWMQNRKMYAAILGDELLDPKTEERFYRLVLRTVDRLTNDLAFAERLKVFIQEQS